MNLISRLLICLFAIGALCSQAQQGGQKKKDTSARITWVNEIKPGKELPPNTAHKTFFSKAANTDVGYCIYLPPNYKEDSSKRYPVIYNLHGNGGNEFHSFEDVTLLHEGIAKGKWPAMIVVLPNGGKSTFYKNSYDGKFPIETMFIRELIPHIDATYRTIAGRKGRCIEGFSMGGRGSVRLALKYPDMFCSLFNQAGNVFHTADKYDPENPTHYLGPDKQAYIDDDPFLILEKNLSKIRGKLRIQSFCGTKDGGHLPSCRDFHQALLEHKVDHTYMEIEDLGHRRTEMIARYQEIWFDYHVESLRRAGAWK